MPGKAPRRPRERTEDPRRYLWPPAVSQAVRGPTESHTVPIVPAVPVVLGLSHKQAAGQASVADLRSQLVGGHPITPIVLNTLNEKFNGKAVTLEQLQAHTGRDRKSIQAAMSRLVADENIVCTVVTRGQMWRYDGATAQNDHQVVDTLFEVVGTAAKGGDTIVRGDASGKLYKVVAI